MAWLPAIIWLLRRRLRSHWILLMVTAFGVLAAVTIIAMTDVYSRALAETAVRHVMAATASKVIDVRLIVQDRPLGPNDYQRLRATAEATTESHIGWMLEDRQRYGRSQRLDMVFSPQEVPPPEEAPTTFDFEEGPAPARVMGRGFFLTDFENKSRLVAGRWPQQPPLLHDGGVELEAAVGAFAAARLGLTVGATLYLVPYRTGPKERIALHVVGLVEPIDFEDNYWVGYLGYFDLEEIQEERFSLFFYLREEHFLKGLGQRYPHLTGEYGWFLYINKDSITAKRANQAVKDLEALETDVNKLVPRTLVISGLDNTLVNYQRDLTLARVPVNLFLYLLVAVMLYFLLLAMGLLAQTRREEASLLRSRGASALQVGSFLLFSDGVLVAVAVVVGPLLGLALAHPILIDALNSGGAKNAAISLGVSSNMFLLAAMGGLLSFGLVVASTFNLARLGMVEFLRERARPPALPWVQRYYLDLVALALIVLVWWQIHSRTGFVAKKLVGDALEVEPTLLLGPMLAFLGVALLVLRALPLIARAGSRIADMAGPAWASVAFRRIAREPVPHATLAVMVLLASGLGIFAVVFQGSLSRSQRDKALYSVGSDMVVLTNDFSFTAQSLAEVPQVATVSPVHRSSVQVSGKPGVQSALLLGVDPPTLPRVAWFRDDFAKASLPKLVDLMASEGASRPGMSLPPDSERLGLWARLDSKGPALTLWVHLRDGNGRYHSLGLGKVQGREWGYLETPLVTRQGPLQPPVYLVGMVTRNPFVTGSLSGSLSLDDITVKTRSDPTTPRVINGFEGANPWVALPNEGAASDTLEQTARAARTGRSGLKFSWAEPIHRELRGVIIPPGAFPLRVLGSRPFFRGEKVQLIANRQRVPVVIEGTIDYFPTTDPTLQRFLLVNSDSYQEYLRLLGAAERPGLGEFWLSLAEGADREQALSAIRGRIATQALVLDSQQAVQESKHNPLGGRNWRGVTILGVIAMAAAVAIASILHGVVSVHLSRVDLVVLRVLGLSRGHLWIGLAVERAVVALFGIVVGGLTGFLLARWALGRVDITLSGDRTVPPMLLTLQPWLLILVLATLVAASLLAVLLTVLMANRLKAVEVLRLGQ